MAERLKRGRKCDCGAKATHATTERDDRPPVNPKKSKEPWSRVIVRAYCDECWAKR